MLRRAAPLVRTLRTATTAVAQSSTTSSNNENVVRDGGERREDRRNMRRGDDQRKPFKRDFKPRFVDEHVQLMRKHGESIENTDLKSLNDAIERINWYAAVSKMTLERVAAMMMKSSIEELNAISDRSMATMFSSFGEYCKEKRRDEKKKLLDETVQKMIQKGYTLGPLSRAAIFTSKVDIAQTVDELPSIVDEISAWESAGISLNEELVLQAARVYAMQGDKKGVIELTNYARESFGRVEVQYLHWLAFSMIASTEGNGINAVERLSRSAPDSSIRLWLSGALAAAYKGDLPLTVECLSRVPLAAKLNHSDQNGPIVDILIQLIERNVEGAEEALSAYLSLCGDGTSLHERHGWNSIAIFKARRAANEGNMEVATRLYALVHEMQKNKTVENELKKGVHTLALKKESNIEEVKKCAKRMQEGGIIEDANAFLLGVFRRDKLIEFVNQLRSTGELTDGLSKCKINRFTIATTLIREASSSSLLSIIPSATAIIYAGPLTFAERGDSEKIIFNAAKENPDVIVKVLQELAESNMADAEILGSTIITCALGRLLIENDILSSGRIEKMIASPFTPVVRLHHIDRKIIGLFRYARDEEKKKKAVEISSKIIIAAFNNRGGRNFYAPSTLARLIGNSGITDDNLEILVNELSKNPSVGIGIADMEKAKTELEQRGLTKRVELIEMLRMKSQASQRWMASSTEDLESELNALEKGGKVGETVLVSIRIILMNKLVEATSISTERMIPLLERLIPTIVMDTKNDEKEEEDVWKKPRMIQLRGLTEKMYGKTLKKTVMEGDWNGAARLWKARGSLWSLPISSALALSFHEHKNGSKELSNDIISIIRSNGHAVSKANIFELGEFFLDFSTDELSNVSEWLKKELRLDANDVARISNARTKRNMGDLINTGNLQEAFNVMKENSEKSENAIGHFDVMRAAIRDNKVQILQDTINMVSSLHSKATAHLDLAFSFLLEHKKELGAKLFKTPSLKLSRLKLTFYIKYAVDEQRPDVIHSLFSILVSCPLSEEKVANSDLNYLASCALRGYVKSKKLDEAKDLLDEINKSTLVVEKQLKELIDRTKNSRSSSV